MSLPERRPATLGQPTYQPQPLRPIEPYRPGPVVFVPDPYDPNRSVAVPAEYVQAPAVYQPRDLTPQPVLDPLAQRILATGIGGGALAAGTGWGAAQALSALAGVGSGAVLWVLLLAIAATRRPVRHDVRITNNNHGWFGRSNITKG